MACSQQCSQSSYMFTNLIFASHHAYITKHSTAKPVKLPHHVAQIKHLWRYIYDINTACRLSHGNVSAIREHTIILSSVCKVPFETKGGVAS